MNYFFKPTIGLIYFVFIALYLTFRGIQRRDFSGDEAVLNGLEALKAAAIGELSEPRRIAAVSLLRQTGADDPFAHQVHALLADEKGLPDPYPSRFEAWGRAVRAWYVALANKRWFERVVVWWFVIVGSGQLVVAVVLSLDHHAIRGFEEWAIVISSAVSGALIVVGVVRLPRHRVAAYRWFERGMLVQIFVTQVFEFAQEQLAGVFGLVLNLLMWVALRAMIRAELEQEVVRSPEPVAS